MQNDLNSLTNSTSSSKGEKISQTYPSTILVPISGQTHLEVFVIAIDFS